jgi:hypothetical protein
MPAHKTGKKITTSHTSIIDAAIPVVEAAEKLPEVTKISLGIIKQVGKSRGQHRVKFQPIVGGWKITVRGSSTVQEIYVYTENATSTKTVIEAEFS